MQWKHGIWHDVPCRMLWELAVPLKYHIRYHRKVPWYRIWSQSYIELWLHSLLIIIMIKNLLNSVENTLFSEKEVQSWISLFLPSTITYRIFVIHRKSVSCVCLNPSCECYVSCVSCSRDCCVSPCFSRARECRRFCSRAGICGDDPKLIQGKDGLPAKMKGKRWGQQIIPERSFNSSLDLFTLFLYWENEHATDT